MTPQTAAGRALAKQVASWTEFPDKYVDAILAIEAEALAAARERIEALDAYHPHEAPYVGGSADLPCNPKACAGGMRLAVLAALAAPNDAPEKP